MGKSVKWEKLSGNDIANYTSRTTENISNSHLRFDLLMCDNPLCTDAAHQNDIDCMYDDLLTCLKSASMPISLDKPVQPDGQQIPGWNIWVKEHYSRARESFLNWRASGNPRTGMLYEQMRQTRAHFRLALRQCLKEKDRHASDSLAKKLLKKDSKEF